MLDLLEWTDESMAAMAKNSKSPPEMDPGGWTGIVT